MSDLIERLRAHAGFLESGGCVDHQLTDEAALLTEAADEIERLRLSCKGVEGWREIETHDGSRTPVLIVAGGMVGEAYFRSEANGDDDYHGWWWANEGPGDYYDDVIDDPVTHWMPLPAAPVSPSPLMDFGASRVRHQPSAATPDGDPTQVKP